MDEFQEKKEVVTEDVAAEETPLENASESDTAAEPLGTDGDSPETVDETPHTESAELLETEKKIGRKQELIRALKYLCFTGSAGAIQLGVSTLLWEVAHLNYWTGYLIALVMSVIWNFTFNRKFTFKSANNVPIAMLKVFAYYCVFTPLSTLWGHALSSIGWNEYAIEVPTMLINGITEFLFCRFVVFGKTINTNDLGQKENEKVKKELEGLDASADESGASDGTNDSTTDGAED